MSVNVRNKIRKLSAAQRKKVKARAAEIIGYGSNRKLGGLRKVK